jgi:hypothetical protein
LKLESFIEKGGERKMKKKILVIALSLAMLALPIASAFAK